MANNTLEIDSDIKIAVIGLGYVGLPLAVEFGKHYTTIGFDINEPRICELKKGVDGTLEVETKELEEAVSLSFSSNYHDIQSADVYIITVPSPIDRYKQPDLSAIKKASETVGKALAKDNVVIYESTVYPGATEEVCVPILEQTSGLIFNQDFYCGYSPERINPGDKKHRLISITKVTSGSTEEAARFVDQLYGSIISAGTHKASSIRVAEAAKVIENTQRDLNIALINELAMIFHRLGIDTEEVLDAAGTKWNFLPFRPGLVGGHCIGVDPYYLTHKAMEVGYHPEIILSGRRVNDNMGRYVVERVTELLMEKKIHVVGAKVLVMGLTFKENCPDIRNTRVIEVIRGFEKLYTEVEVYDPWVNKADAINEYGITPIDSPEHNRYDVIVLAVPHKEFAEMGISMIRSFGKERQVLFDVKHLFSAAQSDGRL